MLAGLGLALAGGLCWAAARRRARGRAGGAASTGARKSAEAAPPEPPRTCAACGEAARLRCSRCKSAWYCSAACQREDWPSHRAVCRWARGTDEAAAKPQTLQVRDPGAAGSGGGGSGGEPDEFWKAQEALDAGHRAYAGREFRAALESYRRALSMAQSVAVLPRAQAPREGGWPRVAAEAARWCGHTLDSLKDREGALQYMQQSLEFVRGATDAAALESRGGGGNGISPRGGGVLHGPDGAPGDAGGSVELWLQEGRARMGLGCIYRKMGRTTEAIEHLDAALAAAEGADDAGLQAAALSNLGAAEIKEFPVSALQRLTQAAALREEQVEQATEPKAKLAAAYHLGTAKVNLSGALHVQGDRDGAEEGYRAALMVFEASRNLDSVCQVLTNLSNLAEEIAFFSSREVAEAAAGRAAEYRRRLFEALVAVMREPPGQCAVCLDEIRVGEPSDRGREGRLVVLRCFHCLHHKCFVEWSKRNATCPECKENVEADIFPTWT